MTCYIPLMVYHEISQALVYICFLHIGPVANFLLQVLLEIQTSRTEIDIKYHMFENTQISNFQRKARGILT